MGNCTVYCLPAHGEQLANSVLEALASVRPIVATNTGSIKEWWRPQSAAARRRRFSRALIEILSSLELQERVDDSIAV